MLTNKVDESHRYCFEQKKADITNSVLKEAEIVFAFTCVGTTRTQGELYPAGGEGLTGTSRALETSSTWIWDVVVQVPTNVRLY